MAITTFTSEICISLSLSTCSFLNHHINASAFYEHLSLSKYYYLWRPVPSSCPLFQPRLFQNQKMYSVETNTWYIRGANTISMSHQIQRFKNQNYRANGRAVIKKMINVSQQNTIVWNRFTYHFYVIFLCSLFLRTNISFRHRLIAAKA